MSLNIKNPEAHELATQLSRITGESLTTTVVKALRERLERERQASSAEPKAERMLAFARRFSAGMKPGCHSSGHDAMVYSEDGLPR